MLCMLLVGQMGVGEVRVTAEVIRSSPKNTDRTPEKKMTAAMTATATMSVSLRGIAVAFFVPAPPLHYSFWAESQ